MEHIAAATELAARNLKAFDELDYEVFSNQDWARLHESHAEDITVHWPDGHETKGLQVHIEDLAAMFTYAPDTKITVHPVKIAAVTGLPSLASWKERFPIP